MINCKISDINQIDDLLSEFTSALADCGLGESVIFLSRLASCELLSNVFRHGGDEALFDGGFSGGIVRIEVSGGDPASISRIALPDAYEETGRGLYIVQSICNGNMEIRGNKISVFISVSDLM